jgi:hypothetical protein
MTNPKVEKFFAKELSKNLKDILILKNEDGSYDLFGRYKINTSEKGYTIAVKDVNTDDERQLFSSLKHAVTWCVFDKQNRKKDLKRIEELDCIISSLDVTISQQKRLAEKCKSYEDKSIFLAKLMEGKIKKKLYLDEINGYVITSKYLQTKKFEETGPK